MERKRLGCLLLAITVFFIFATKESMSICTTVALPFKHLFSWAAGIPDATWKSYDASPNTFDGWAIKCWECRSDTDGGCADPFDNSTFHFTDCDRQSLPHIHTRSTLCRKIRQKVNGQWRYIRSCAWLSDKLKMERRGDERYCLIRSGTWDIHIEYCECYSKDGCNSSTTRLINWSLILSTFLCSLVFLRVI